MLTQIDDIWQYSRYYGDMIATSVRLHDNEEDYAAMMILFNALELIFKSVRENFKESFIADIEDLKNQGLLLEDDYRLLNDGENGMRKIRNIMTHRDAYQYVLEDADGYAMPFAEAGTWATVYELYAKKIIDIIVSILKLK